MAKPRQGQRDIEKKNRPRRRGKITTREREAVDAHMWFALTVWSQKERLVERGLREMGFPSAFTPLDVRYRRGSRFKKDKDFERFNIATLPSYVFVGVPPRWRGLPFFDLYRAKIAGSPPGMSHMTGYVSDGSGAPVCIAQGAIASLMAKSMIPLYLDREEEEGFAFDYGDAAPDEVLEPGDMVTVAEGLLKGERFRVGRMKGRDAVIEVGGRELILPAKTLSRAA